jgi:hypothetical protein
VGCGWCFLRRPALWCLPAITDAPIYARDMFGVTDPVGVMLLLFAIAFAYLDAIRDERPAPVRRLERFHLWGAAKFAAEFFTLPR